jgi:predicted outer membrane protein
MRTSWHGMVGAAATLVVLAAFAQAQQQQPAARQAVDRGDQELAQLLVDCDDSEIVISQAVLEKVRNDEVKSFAQKMIKEHTEARQKVVQLTSLPVRGAAPATGRPANERPAGAAPNQNANPNANAPANQNPNRAARQANQPIDLLALNHEVKEQCVASALEDISKKEGSEIEKCYIGMQIAAHQGALDKIKVFKNHASANLRAHLDEREKAVEEHLKDAKDIMKDLAKESKKSAKAE